MASNNTPNHGLDANLVLRNAYDSNLGKLITGKAKKAGSIVLTSANTGVGTEVIAPFNAASVDAFILIMVGLSSISTTANFLAIQISPDDDGSTWLPLTIVNAPATTGAATSASASLVIARRIRVVSQFALAGGESLTLGMMVK